MSSRVAEIDRKTLAHTLADNYKTFFAEVEVTHPSSSFGLNIQAFSFYMFLKQTWKLFPFAIKMKGTRKETEHKMKGHVKDMNAEEHEMAIKGPMKGRGRNVRGIGEEDGNEDEIRMKRRILLLLLIIMHHYATYLFAHGRDGIWHSVKPS